ncbi:hypothetical protein PG996_008935 [Apiospora saccharicola]|uniref:2EXR domain-containing protein n=1 Tax=Apiospora saccharicola TaxID=335842 RepID=A0ABR1UZF1_9PEZI
MNDSDLATQMDNQLVLSTSATKPTKPTTFHPFVRLPIELRIKIWEQFIPETRGRLVWMRQPGWILADKERFTSILLSACRESREEVYLKRFPMALELTLREASPSGYWDKQLLRIIEWDDRIGTIYINPEHDVLVLGQPWVKDYNDFTLLAKPLRREEPRSRIRNIIEFPGAEELKDEFDIMYSEGENWRWQEDPDDTPENRQWGLPTKHWTFEGVTKHLTLTAPLDDEETLQFYHDAKELSGQDVLQKWGGKFTVS